MKVLKPSSFDTAQSAKILENFPWDLDQYFKDKRVPYFEQVFLIGMYLTNDTKLWL